MSRTSKHYVVVGKRNRMGSDKFMVIGAPVGRWTKADKQQFVASASVCSILPSLSVPVIASRFVGLKRMPIRNYFGKRRSIARDFERTMREVVALKIELWQMRYSDG